MRVNLKKEYPRKDLVEDEKVQERHLVQIIQALDRVQRYLVRVDHFAGEFCHLFACQLPGLLLLLHQGFLPVDLPHVPVLVLRAHLFDIDILEYFQPFEVVIAMRLLQQLLA